MSRVYFLALFALLACARGYKGVQHVPAAPQAFLPAVAASVGGTATLRCMFHGNPKPKIMWRFRAQTIESNASRHKQKPDGSLVINPLYSNDTGIYFCVADNRFGLASQQVHLVVNDPFEGRDSCREFREEYDSAVSCPYGIHNWTLNGCNRWKCKEDPCVKVNCSSSEHCERVERVHPNSQGDIYSAWCADGPDCKPFQKECYRLQHCDLGIEKINGTDGCERCKCKQNPCKKISCTEGKRCVLQKSMPLNDQKPVLYAECISVVKAGACPVLETSPHNDTCTRECADDADCRGMGKCCRRGCSLLCLAPVALTSIPCQPAAVAPDSIDIFQCYNYLDICSRLHCEYGMQRTRLPDGCEKCSCVQVEIDCESLKQECNYGIERTFGSDGRERCKCKKYPCERKSCASDERCMVLQYMDALNLDRQFTAECRSIVKPGACPVDETTTNEVSCRGECADDADCRGVGKCCRRGCSDICLMPVGQTSPNPLLTTTIAPNEPAPPIALPPQEPVVAVTEGGTATLRCLFHGNPTPKITWRFGEVTIDGNAGRYRLKSDGALEIVSLYRNDTGGYICVADNGVGVAMQEIHLVVNDSIDIFQCDDYMANCSRLRCEYGMQRTRLPDGCEKCSCVQVEINCEPLKQECNYGIERTFASDGSERCKCKKYPCERKSCASDERCMVLQYMDALNLDRQFTAECRSIVKPGACPVDETTTDEVSCRGECADDADCRGVGKCCRRGCSDICLMPVGQSSPNPLLTTTIAPNEPAPPIALPPQEPVVAVTEGGTTTLRCLFHGNPTPKITWRFREVTIDGNAGRYRLESDGALEIVTLYRNDTGVYICVADNGVGVAMQEIHLVVNDSIDIFQCVDYMANCSRLRCEYGMQRTRLPDGCEKCSCVQVEINCEPLKQECNYGIERTFASDGSERCKCKKYPCERKSCASDERCMVLQYMDALNLDRQFTAECRSIVKPGACPVDETTTKEVLCRGECADDADCRGVGKCCRRGCSDICLMPVEQTSPHPLLTTTIAPNEPAPPIALPPQEPVVAVTEGGTATLRCLFYGNPTPKITWRFGEVTIDGNAGRYRLKSDGALEIVSLYRNDTGGYICVADNGVGVAMQEIHLVVNDSIDIFQCDDYMANCSRLRCEYGMQRTRLPDGCEKCSCVQVEINCEPLKQECNYGIERTFASDGSERCKCKKYPCERKSCASDERCMVLQYIDALDLDRQFTAECRSIVKPGACPVDETTTDEVSCRGECADDADCRGVGKCCRRGCSDICLMPVEQTSPNPLLTTTIAPNEPAPPIALPPQEPVVAITEGGTATLRSLFHGNPPPKITWRFGEVTIDGNTGRYRLTSDGTLEIVSLYRNDTGVYICVADNGVGVAMQEIHLVVNVPVSTHVLTPFSTLNIGADLRLTCEVDGFPEPDVHWTKDGANIQTDGRIAITSSTIVSRLTVTRVSVADSGVYACHASNPYSSQSDSAQINVQQLVVPAKCTDNPVFVICALVVRSKSCRHKYYSKFCCKSCVEAGQLDPQEAELQADQPLKKK